MNKGAKIGLIFLAAAVVGGAITYYVYTELGQAPEVKVTGINPNNRTAVITIGKKQVNYTFASGSVLQLGKVSPFYTAQVVAYKIEDPGEAARIDIKLMRNGKLASTKTVYLG